MAWRSVPCCERCWIEQEGEWDMETHGNEVWQKLVSLRQPIMLRLPLVEVETCYACGWPTFIGLFVRRDVMVDADDNVIPEALRDGKDRPAVDPPEVIL